MSNVPMIPVSPPVITARSSQKVAVHFKGDVHTLETSGQIFPPIENALIEWNRSNGNHGILDLNTLAKVTADNYGQLQDLLRGKVQKLVAVGNLNGLVVERSYRSPEQLQIRAGASDAHRIAVAVLDYPDLLGEHQNSGMIVQIGSILRLVVQAVIPGVGWASFRAQNHFEPQYKTLKPDDGIAELVFLPAGVNDLSLLDGYHKVKIPNRAGNFRQLI